jgi:peptidylprolyl isomerase
LDAAAAKAQIEVLKKGQQTEIETFAKANNMQLKTLPSGLNYVIETEGTGAQAQAGKTVSVHYTGKLLNGTKFDSSVDRGQPIEFPLGVGQVIKGWDEGIALFKVGGKGKLLIPSYLAYGEQGSPPVISPNSVLVFDIELVNVK